MSNTPQRGAQLPPVQDVAKAAASPSPPRKAKPVDTPSNVAVGRTTDVPRSIPNAESLEDPGKSVTTQRDRERKIQAEVEPFAPVTRVQDK